MMFVASKILWAVLQPSSLLALAMAFGILRALVGRTPRPGIRMAAIALTLLCGLGVSPAATWLIVPLEDRFPAVAVPEGSRDYAGIIVLGGGEDGRVSTARGQLHLNEAGERITQAVILARSLPSTRLIFTGGVGSIVSNRPSAASPVGTYWQSIGIAAERIALEDRSRNTHENAVLTRDMVMPKAGERWLLVTSAAHMPRAMGVFRQAGFDVTAYPVDFRTAGADDLFQPFDSLPAGLKRLDDAAKEWLGLVAYWLLGRSSALFPGP